MENVVPEENIHPDIQGYRAIAKDFGILLKLIFSKGKIKFIAWDLNKITQKSTLGYFSPEVLSYCPYEPNQNLIHKLLSLVNTPRPLLLVCCYLK